MMKLCHDWHVHTYLSACCHEKERQTPRAILSLAKDMGVNTIGFADHLWANPDIRILSIAKQAGCKFTLGSDAHSPEQQKKLPELAVLTKTVGVTEEDMLRARPDKTLKATR